MPYEFDFETIDNYVRVEVQGDRGAGDAAMQAGQVGREIVKYCRNAGLSRVLIVLKLRGRLSAFDSFDMVNQSLEYGWDRSFKLAFVETNSDSLEDVKFTETVAVNRAYSVKAFADEAEAVDWLVS